MAGNKSATDRDTGCVGRENFRNLSETAGKPRVAAALKRERLTDKPIKKP
jgi:hypothetical protein